MRIGHSARFLIIALIVLIITGCSNTVSTEEEIPVETLLAAPLSLDIGNQSIKLSTYMSIDFMPAIPAGSPPLMALTYIETVDSTVINSSINPYMMYIVYNGKAWKLNFSTENPASPELRPYRIVKIMRDGPKLNTGIYVDVIVSIKVNNHKYLLRAEKQYINRLD